jgi:hypothetical protein
MPVKSTKQMIDRRKEMNEGLIQRLNNQLEEIGNKLSQLTEEIRTAEAARKEREKNNADDLEKMKIIIWGDGKNPGLNADVPMLKKDMARVYWLGGVILVALIGNIVAMWFVR